MRHLMYKRLQPCKEINYFFSHMYFRAKSKTHNFLLNLYYKNGLTTKTKIFHNIGYSSVGENFIGAPKMLNNNGDLIIHYRNIAPPTIAIAIVVVLSCS